LPSHFISLEKTLMSILAVIAFWIGFLVLNTAVNVSKLKLYGFSACFYICKKSRPSSDYLIINNNNCFIVIIIISQITTNISNGINILLLLLLLLLLLINCT